MHRKIVYLAAFALLTTISAQAADVELPVSGPSIQPIGANAEYKLTFSLSGPVAPRDPIYKLRNPAGQWTEGSAVVTSSGGTNPRTITVKKTVTFPAGGTWRVYLKTDLWTTPPCRKSPCPEPYRSGSRYGSKDVGVVAM